jgi:hypothetical protein
LQVVIAGKLLAALSGVTGSEKLMDRVKEGREDAWAELEAIYLLRGSHERLIIEAEPVVPLRGRDRKADLR